MFACPHCQFENPPQNRFCQRCGNALRGLRAVIVPEKTRESSLASQPQTAITLEGSQTIAAPLPAEPMANADTSPIVADLLTEHNYFRGETRYQLRSPQGANQPITAELVLDLLDCELADDSPISHLLDAIISGDVNEPVQNLIPTAAVPYWKLQEQFFPMVPELQAAWQENGVSVIVLEDRSTWKTVAELADVANEIESLELVHWLYEIVGLWEALKGFQAEESLLKADNLRVDDDHILCIERLIYNAPNSAPTLQDLGRFWQSLLQQFPERTVPPLKHLVTDMGSGIINNIAAIEEILADIADNLQKLSEPHPISPSEPVPTTTSASSRPIVAADADQGVLPDFALDDLPEEDSEAFDETADADSEGIDDNFADLPTMALPMKLNRLDEFGRTHVGRQRHQNEDFFFTETELKRVNTPSGPHLSAKGLYILCDGMGGHSGGEIASALAVKTLRNYFAEHWQAGLPDEAMVTEAIFRANEVIFQQNEAEGRTGNARMGTTLVMVLIADNQAVVAHVGDSRLYCLTRDRFEQMTVDHEVGQREINRGVEPAIAYARPDAYQLTQALGPRGNEEVTPTITLLPIQQDSLFLLCSDGLSDNQLLDKHFESHVKPLLRSRQDLEEGVGSLIDLANEHNGHDNITAIAVRVKLRPNLEAVNDTPEPLLLSTELPQPAEAQGDDSDVH
jgi:protein phosphatase